MSEYIEIKKGNYFVTLCGSLTGISECVDYLKKNVPNVKIDMDTGTNGFSKTRAIRLNMCAQSEHKPFYETIQTELAMHLGTMGWRMVSGGMARAEPINTITFQYILAR